MKAKANPGPAIPEQSFPIVAIGASAGGLAALERFLSALPAAFGFPLIFMQHLSADYKSLLPDLLRSRTSIDVVEVEDRLRPLPGKMYLCPPAQEVTMAEGFLHVHSRSEEHLHLPIDELFVSLAEHVPERTIAIIFSGAGTDGARGVQAVRSGGGTVFVQDPATAEFPSMPLAAINTGQMDGVLSPEEIGREIARLHSVDIANAPPEGFLTPEQLGRFSCLITQKSGFGFDHYKKSVVARRIRRRMYLAGIASVDDYLEMVEKKEGEEAALASDLMIGVTSFFRDRLAWKALHLNVTRKLAARNEDGPIRVWCVACATGEEAYSIAMMLQHELEHAGKKREINIFATDVNDRALERAREGIYPSSIAADVPAEFFQKFFTRAENDLTVAIAKEIRQQIVFAKQDLLTDPPFSRLDLLICRNLLIYLEPDAQEKCIALFHYALNDNGYLFLGNAESPGRKSALFTALPHKKCRIYRKLGTTASPRMPLAIPFVAERPSSASKPAGTQREESLTEVVQEALLEVYALAAVAINQNNEILYHSGPTNRYLRHPRGITTQNLLDLVPENVRNRIRGGLFRAAQEDKPVAIRATIADEHERKQQVTIRISKVREHLFLIVFKEKRLPEETEALPLEDAVIEETAVRQLEYELSTTRENVQSYVEQLKSLNEELQSSNEELQAANEELETSREELQSLNEELVTVNAQLQVKVEEEEGTNNDLNNFLVSTNIPTIFLDTRLRVKRFTPAMLRLIKLIPADAGRPIIDMSQEHLGPDLITDAGSVLDSLTPVKREFQTNDAWYVRTTLPYRTADNRIEGVVVTYTDVTERKRAEEHTSHLASFPQLNPNPVIEVDITGKATFANPATLRILEGMGMGKEELRAFLPDDLDTILKEWDTTHESVLYREMSIEDRIFGESIDLIPEFKVVRIYAYDITERKRAEEELRENRAKLEASLGELELRVQERTEELRRQAELLELSHEAILVKDSDSRIAYWSKGAEETYGWTKTEALGNVIHTFLKTQFPIPFEEYLSELMGQGRWEGELVHTRKDGEQIIVLTRQTLQRDSAGTPVGTLEINIDITAQRRLEDELRQSHKMEAIGTLAGGIAHDFNNILAAMIGFSELAMDSIPAESKAQHQLNRIFEAGLRARELVRQILTFSRKMDSKREEVSLAPLVQETYALLRASLPSTIEMSLVVSTNHDYVLAHPTQIQQVLLNLATNAADAMREGGQLTIEVSSITFPPGSLLPDPGMHPGTYLQLTVKDTGIGMTEGVQKRIFEPFFTTKQMGKGTGMGLAVVYGIVKAHGGAITVESKERQGSTFTIFLPQVQRREAKEEEEEEEEETPAALPAGAERILFVDDEELLVEMAKATLEGLGYHVTVAQRPADALKLFLKDPSRFDLVITDQIMPDMTGLTLAQKLLEVRKELPVILCTGYSEMVSEEKAQEAGVRAFLMKPLARKELTETIRKVLDRRQGGG